MTKTIKDFDPRALKAFDKYVHGGMTKREFLKRAAEIAGGAAGGLALYEALAPDYARAQEVAPDDPDIVTSWVEYDSPNGNGKTKGLMAKPAKDGPFGAVLVVHENRGLNPYVEDVVRRVAKAGYLALGPDGLTSLGGYPGNDDDGRAIQRQLDPQKLLEDFFAGFEYLRDHADSTGKVGAVGFCYGGGVCNALAVRFPEMACSVPFYGRQPAAEDVPAINAPLMLHYAGEDARIDAGWPAYEAALKANGKTYEVYFYEGASHGFHNYSTPRYDEAAAKLAWARTLGWFEKYLG